MPRTTAEAKTGNTAAVTQAEPPANRGVNEPAKDGKLASANDLDLYIYPLLEKAGDDGVSQKEIEKACGNQAHKVIGRLSDLLESGIVSHPMAEDGEGDDLRRFIMTKGGRTRYKQFYEVAQRRQMAMKK